MTAFIRRMSFIFLVMAGGASFAANAITLDFDPTAPAVTSGNQVTVDIIASDLMGELIAVYDLDVNWDPAILSLASVDFDMFLGGPLDAIQLDTPMVGMVNTFELSFLLGADLAMLQDGVTPFRLFSLTFDTLMVGNSALSFNLFNMGDDLGAPLQPDVSAQALVEVLAPSTTVPLPATSLLLLSGLLLNGVRQRRNNKQPNNGIDL